MIFYSSDLFVCHDGADEYSREPGEFDQQMEDGDERPIDPISDISITRINHLMFNSSDAK